MRNIKRGEITNESRNPLLVIVLSMLSISVPVIAADSPDAMEILHRFTEARKNFTSFIFEAETKTTFNYPQHNWTGTRYDKFECRSDGNRCRTRTSMWGNIDMIRSKNVSKEHPDYSSYLWDAEHVYYYNRDSQSGYVTLCREKDPGGIPDAYKNYAVSDSIYPGQIMGYTRGDKGKRIGEMLELAESLKLRQERLRGADCYVIEGVVKQHGEYTVWIDPTHDYHIAKIRIQRKENDYFNDRRAGKGDSIDSVFEVLNFERFGDVLLPKKCKLERTICNAGDCGTESKIVNITNIVLNPDHDALKSFVPDDIPNETPVGILAFPSVEFIWKDGKVVDENGREIEDFLKKTDESQNKSKSNEKR